MHRCIFPINSHHFHLIIVFIYLFIVDFTTDSCCLCVVRSEMGVVPRLPRDGTTNQLRSIILKMQMKIMLFALLKVLI